MQSFGFHGNAQNGQNCLGCSNPGQVSRATRCRDDYFQAALRGRRSILKQEVWCAMCRNDLYFIRDLQFVQLRCGVLHRFPIRLTSHDDANEWFSCATHKLGRKKYRSFKSMSSEESEFLLILGRLRQQCLNRSLRSAAQGRWRRPAHLSCLKRSRLVSDRDTSVCSKRTPKWSRCGQCNARFCSRRAASRIRKCRFGHYSVCKETTFA